MRWAEYNGSYPPGYIVSADQTPRTHSHYGKRHGPAVLHYFDGREIGAENLLLADGSRGKAECTLHHKSAWRRPINAHDRAWVGMPTRWQWGTLALSDNDICFVDLPNPVPEIQDDDGAPILGAALRASQEMKAAVCSFDEAVSLFALLKEFAVVRQSDGLVQRTSSTGEAAQLVADIRGIGEYYVDFKFLEDVKLADPLGAEQRVEAVLKRLGWGGPFEQEVRLSKAAAAAGAVAGIRKQDPAITGIVGPVALEEGEQVFIAWKKNDER